MNCKSITVAVLCSEFTSPFTVAKEKVNTHLPFLVTIISFVTSLNLCHRAESSKITWSCFSVGSPLSLPARSSFSTTLSSLEMVQSLCFLQPKSVMVTLMSETSQVIFKKMKEGSLHNPL